MSLDKEANQLLLFEDIETVTLLTTFLLIALTINVTNASNIDILLFATPNNLLNVIFAKPALSLVTYTRTILITNATNVDTLDILESTVL